MRRETANRIAYQHGSGSGRLIGRGVTIRVQVGNVPHVVIVFELIGSKDVLTSFFWSTVGIVIKPRIQVGVKQAILLLVAGRRT